MTFMNISVVVIFVAVVGVIFYVHSHKKQTKQAIDDLKSHVSTTANSVVQQVKDVVDQTKK